MKRTIGIFTTGLFVAALVTPVAAQDLASVEGRVRVIQKGDLDIIVEGATNDDLNIAQYRAFDRFAAEHPQTVEILKKNPELLDSEKYLVTHRELTEFLDAHPDIKPDYDANPGNYVPLEPSVEKAVETRARQVEVAGPLRADEIR